MSDHPKPDLLHTLQIGMLDHLQMWMFHLMNTHEQLDKYNASGFTCLITPTSHQKIRHMSKFLNGMERR